MKLTIGPKIILSLLSTGSVVVVAQRTSGFGDANVTEANNTITDAIEAASVAELRQFSDAMTQYLHENVNDCTSMWGISMVLDLLRPASGFDDGLEQMCNTVGLCGSENDVLWEDTQTRIVSKYSGGCPRNESEGELVAQYCAEGRFGSRPILTVANSIWIDDGAVLNADYAAVVGDDLFQIDFQSETAGDTINSWISDATNDLIPTIVPPGRILNNMIAINSIYLAAQWAYPFEPSNTMPGTFYVDESTTVEAQFMDQISFAFDYSNSTLEGFEVIRIPYSNGNISMIVAMPSLLSASDDTTITRRSLTQAEDTEKLRNLGSSQLYDALGNLTYTGPVNLKLPKFKFESEYDSSLEQALREIGLTFPFTDGFCSVFQDDTMCMMLGKMVQKTSIEIDERGTVAAAATMGAVGRQIVPENQTIPFVVDRPFKFFIYDESEEIFIFEGIVGNPNVTDNTVPGTPTASPAPSGTDAPSTTPGPTMVSSDVASDMETGTPDGDDDTDNGNSNSNANDNGNGNDNDNDNGNGNTDPSGDGRTTTRDASSAVTYKHHGIIAAAVCLVLSLVAV